jgi:transposase
MRGMGKPVYARALTDEEHQQLEAGLRASTAFELRRCQILLASARGQRAPVIAKAVGCDEETVRNVIKAFNAKGLTVLKRRSTRPHHTQAAFTPENAERLRELLHRSPREFGKATSLWTLELAADVSFEQGLTQERVTDETIRLTLKRLGIRWKRAKHWITSPDPAYVRKKTPATD